MTGLTAAWIPCDCCEDFICTIHERHAHDCECPPIDEWGDVDPYSEKPKMNSTNRVLKHRQEAAKQGRKRKEYLVTDNEHLKIKALLREMRARWLGKEKPHISGASRGSPPVG